MYQAEWQMNKDIQPRSVSMLYYLGGLETIANESEDKLDEQQ